MATAQQPQTLPILCFPYEHLTGQLADQYGEQLAADGLAAGGALIQLFTSEEKDSWTLLMLTPTGRACVMATGEGWSTHMLPQPTGEKL